MLLGLTHSAEKKLLLHFLPAMLNSYVENVSIKTRFHLRFTDEIVLVESKHRHHHR